MTLAQRLISLTFFCGFVRKTEALYPYIIEHPPMLTNPFLRLRKRSAFLSIVSLLLFSIGARAEEWGYYTYEVVNGNTVIVTGYTGPDGAITIPSVIDEKPVTAIGIRAFYQCSGLTGNLVIPEGVTSIGDYAFGRCSGLNGTLTLPSTLESIGYMPLTVAMV
ncbi:MAG: hypothetical protein BWY82_02931 [Verrucomicrobia bacterium ADurb.Bin474]|nr:MAG: hypothetical protein BWY82_02931 [Verrucomicrobia bacterium ADurb.Bin474]